MFIISLTDFISENTRPISIKFYVQLHGRDGVGGILFEWSRSDDQDGCYIQSIYGINEIEIFFSNTAWLIPTKFGM